MNKQYKKLNMLRAALGLNQDKEMSENLIFNFVSEHNYNEFYLMEYIINKTIYAPTEIKDYNFLLISLYDNPKEYKKWHKAAKEIYKNERTFRNFANSLREDLDLHDRDNCKLFNYQIYEICSEYITEEIALEPTDVHLNLHLMQKWILKQTELKLGPFTNIEKGIIYQLANGHSVHTLVKESLARDEKDKNFLDTIMHKILPAKCRVKTINQVMATICCHYPDSEKIESLLAKEKKVV